jgi:hypothetical protein
MLLVPRIVLIILLTDAATQTYTSAYSIEGQARQQVDQGLLDEFGLYARLDLSFQTAFCLYASTALLYEAIHFHRNVKQLGGKLLKRRLRFFMVSERA